LKKNINNDNNNNNKVRSRGDDRRRICKAMTATITTTA